MGRRPEWCRVGRSQRFHSGPMNQAGLSADEQTAILADRYSQRADAYDQLWNPLLRAPRKAQALGSACPHGRADPGACRQPIRCCGVAFVLFHVPSPERCLSEVNRVLKPAGTMGTVTWGAERVPMANAVWDEELEAAGARVLELPATDNRACCDDADKVTLLLEQAGFGVTRAWSGSIEYPWRPEDYFEHQTRSTSRLRLLSLDDSDREACLRRIRESLAGAGDEDYVYSGEVVMAIAQKTAVGGHTGREDDG